MSILESIINALLALIGGPMSSDALAAALDRQAWEASEKLDWRNSIVDLMKLTGQDSSLAARERLAVELGYTGPFNGSAAMNIWVHARVLEQLARKGAQ